MRDDPTSAAVAAERRVRRHIDKQGYLTPAEVDARIALVGVWQDFIPTLLNFTGTVETARYCTFGKTCRVQVRVTLDATPTGRMDVVPPIVPVVAIATGDSPIGDAIATDTGTARYSGVTKFVNGNFAFVRDASLSFFGAAVPHAWVSGDAIGFNAEYEIA